MEPHRPRAGNWLACRAVWLAGLVALPGGPRSQCKGTVYPADQTQQAAQGNGSYTEAAKLQPSEYLCTAAGGYTGCKHPEDPVRAAAS